MGLNISGNTWDDGYISFHRWRCKIAEVAGLPPLDLMERFFESKNSESWVPTFPYFGMDKQATDTMEKFESSLPIRWDILKPDPLYELLYHSDCDGYIPYGRCRRIAKRLEELLPLLPDEDGGGHIGNWREKTQKFIDGLMWCAENRRRAIFS